MVDSLVLAQLRTWFLNNSSIFPRSARWLASKLTGLETVVVVCPEARVFSDGIPSFVHHLKNKNVRVVFNRPEAHSSEAVSKGLVGSVPDQLAELFFEPTGPNYSFETLVNLEVLDLRYEYRHRLGPTELFVPHKVRKLSISANCTGPLMVTLHNPSALKELAVDGLSSVVFRNATLAPLRSLTMNNLLEHVRDGGATYLVNDWKAWDQLRELRLTPTTINVGFPTALKAFFESHPDLRLKVLRCDYYLLTNVLVPANVFPMQTVTRLEYMTQKAEQCPMVDVHRAAPFVESLCVCRAKFTGPSTLYDLDALHSITIEDSQVDQTFASLLPKLPNLRYLEMDEVILRTDRGESEAISIGSKSLEELKLHKVFASLDALPKLTSLKLNKSRVSNNPVLLDLKTLVEHQAEIGHLRRFNFYDIELIVTRKALSAENVEEVAKIFGGKILVAQIPDLAGDLSEECMISEAVMAAREVADSDGKFAGRWFHTSYGYADHPAMIYRGEPGKSICSKESGAPAAVRKGALVVTCTDFPRPKFAGPKGPKNAAAAAEAEPKGPKKGPANKGQLTKKAGAKKKGK